MDKGAGKRLIKEDGGFSGLEELIASIEETISKEESEIYTEKTLEEAYNPKNVGELKNPDGVARITGPCGDTMQMHIRVYGDKIMDSKFITDGCGASIACGSVVTEMVKGKTIEEAINVEDKDILSILGGLPEENLHCPVLAVNTLRAALEDYNNKKRVKKQEERR
ncbi:MAG: iron-sulfur cluster assembly scaffold protein [archaeon]|nr:iron-sulfur cluster assembly scaffold protein [archaeon]